LAVRFVDYGDVQVTHLINKQGVDVMITFCCDFCLFSAKKNWCFFSKTNVMIIFI
jgi:hypothetical protein